MDWGVDSVTDGEVSSSTGAYNGQFSDEESESGLFLYQDDLFAILASTSRTFPWFCSIHAGFIQGLPSQALGLQFVAVPPGLKAIKSMF